MQPMFSLLPSWMNFQLYSMIHQHDANWETHLEWWHSIIPMPGKSKPWWRYKIPTAICHERLECCLCIFNKYYATLSSASGHDPHHMPMGHTSKTLLHERLALLTNQNCGSLTTRESDEPCVHMVILVYLVWENGTSFLSFRTLWVRWMRVDTRCQVTGWKFSKRPERCHPPS